MTREQVITIVNQYIDAVKTRQFERLPFSDTITFQGPLHRKPLEGREAVEKFLHRITPVIEDIQITRYVVDGNDVFITLDYVTRFGDVVKIADYVRIEQGEIVHIRPYFDPKPLLRT